MDKLEELERRWRAIAEQAEEVVRVSRNEGQKDEFCGRQYMAEKCADDLSALRDYVLIPREPTQEDVERVVLYLKAHGYAGDSQTMIETAMISWHGVIGAHADET